MFSIGNIIPESMITGSMKMAADTIRAAIWLSTSVDTSSPIDNDRTTYSSDTSITLNMVWETGSPRTV